MKKVISLIMVALLLLGMTACGTAGQNETPTDGNATEGTKANDKQSADKFVVGICQLTPHAALDAATDGFIDALKEALGEENVEIIEKIGGGDMATCTPIINDFVAKGVDLIMANATPALQAAAAATEEIPILGTSVTEYGVALELENFTGTVGTNVSGTSDLAPLDQQADMIKEWFPDAKNVGLLYCSAEANSKYQVDVVTKELEADGLTVTAYAFSDTNDLSMVTQTAAANSDVIYIPTDNAVAAATGTVYDVCSATETPIITGDVGTCSGCGVATLGINYYDLGVTTGKMAAKILKGEAKVSELPIEYAPATKQYNKTICDELKLTVPEGYVAIGE